MALLWAVLHGPHSEVLLLPSVMISIRVLERTTYQFEFKRKVFYHLTGIITRGNLTPLVGFLNVINPNTLAPVTGTTNLRRRIIRRNITVTMLPNRKFNLIKLINRNTVGLNARTFRQPRGIVMTLRPATVVYPKSTLRQRTTIFNLGHYGNLNRNL